MEKYNDSPTSRNEPLDFESASLLPTPPIHQESLRRRNYTFLTLLNLFIFTLSMLSLLCAVISQRDISSYDAAKLMDQFGIYCESLMPAFEVVEMARRSKRGLRTRRLGRVG